MIEFEGDQRPTILALSIVFPIVSILAVILRFEARRVKSVYLGADDWTILAALILTLGVTFDVLIDSRLGRLGWHTVFTSKGVPLYDESFKIFGKTTYALEILIWPCIGLNKISVLLFYKRIFIDRRFQIVVWCFIGLCIAWTIAFEFALMFSCMPIASEWNPDLDGECVDQIALFTAALATDVITDGLILLLPVYNVMKLQMRNRHKVAIIAIFCLGGFTTITGIIRLHFLTYAFSSLANPLFSDVTYHYGPVFYWSIIESNTGILSACLPTLRPLLEAYPPSSLFSKLTRPFSDGFRRSSSDIRLSSMENGRNEAQSETLGVQENKAYTSYDDSHPGPEAPNVILHQKKYNASQYTDKS